MIHKPVVCLALGLLLAGSALGPTQPVRRQVDRRSKCRNRSL
jgi:hypothetical protein